MFWNYRNNSQKECFYHCENSFMSWNIENQTKTENLDNSYPYVDYVRIFPIILWYVLININHLSYTVFRFIQFRRTFYVRQIPERISETKLPQLFLFYKTFLLRDLLLNFSTSIVWIFITWIQIITNIFQRGSSHIFHHKFFSTLKNVISDIL